MSFLFCTLNTIKELECEYWTLIFFNPMYDLYEAVCDEFRLSFFSWCINALFCIYQSFFHNICAMFNNYKPMPICCKNNFINNCCSERVIIIIRCKSFLGSNINSWNRWAALPFCVSTKSSDINCFQVYSFWNIILY